MLRVVRASRRDPVQVSRCCTYLVTAEGEALISRAAAAKLPDSTTRRKDPSAAFRSMLPRSRPSGPTHDAATLARAFDVLAGHVEGEQTGRGSPALQPHGFALAAHERRVAT